MAVYINASTCQQRAVCMYTFIWACTQEWIEFTCDMYYCVAHTRNLSTREAKAGESGAQGQLEVYEILYIYIYINVYKYTHIYF